MPASLAQRRANHDVGQRVQFGQTVERRAEPLRTTIILMFCVLACSVNADPADEPPSQWWSQRGDGAYVIDLYFFWTRTCPHCQAARPDIARLSEDWPWVRVHSLSLTNAPENGRRYVTLASQIGERAQSVPAFLFCGRMLTGYDNPQGMGSVLREALQTCREQLARGENPLASPTPPAATHTWLPSIGEVDLEQWSLPLVTITLGALDSLNPCAFFVLLFLLSLLVHARSRARMLLIGGVFVGISGLVYFLFMAAWLNLFLFVGEVLWITTGAGLLALIMGLINIKDFFYFQRGVSLSIPEGAKPGLFNRMRRLVGAPTLASMLVGTVVLGILANAYELLCTAGFPMVFSRILTLRELSPGGYYSYIVLYCLVYVLPLFLIVMVFALTLGQRKLSANEGRLLKLMSGLMMAALGTILILAPAQLNKLGTTLIMLAAVLVVTAGAWRWMRNNA
jgi:thiol-disulfide isomerase/thioredoxin